MLFDLDALKGSSRRSSHKFRWLAGYFELRQIPKDYAWEIAVLANTPGIEKDHIRSWMFWSHKVWDNAVVPILQEFQDDESVTSAAFENAGSIVPEDGRDMILAMRGELRKAGLPVYSTMWLQDEFRAGRTIDSLAKDLGVSWSTVRAWKKLHGYSSGRW